VKKAISRRCAKNTARRRLSRARFSAAVWRACSVDRGSFFISGGECRRRMAAPIKIVVCDEVPAFLPPLENNPDSIQLFKGKARRRSAVCAAPGEPCDHPGCLSHVSHPCEGCGRVGGAGHYFASQYMGIPWKSVLKTAPELVPDIISRRVDAHESGVLIVGGNSMGKTAALKILMAKPVKGDAK
jgi:hypothetical protein